MNIEIQPYFAEGERYPALIGVRVEGDEYETAYVSKGELADALTENAKLRELVIAQCECVKHDDCNECVHYSEDKCMFPFKSMYRELGVEVD